MDFIATIVMLISLAFIVLSIVGLIKPEKGGFWMKFVTEKKRLKVFGINIGASIVCFILFSIVTPDNPYLYGTDYLSKNQFTEALEEFNKLSVGQDHYDEKEALIQSVYDNAKTYYTDTIDTALDTLDVVVINEANNSYYELSGERAISEGDLELKITKIVDNMKSDIKIHISNEEYSKANELLKNLSNIESESSYVEETIESIQNIIFKSTIAEINTMINQNEYSKAKDLAFSLSNIKTSTEIINDIVDDIIGFEKEYQEQQEQIAMENYKKSAISVRYGDLLRNPDDFKGRVIYLRGEINQEIKPGMFRMLTEYTDYLGYLDDPIVFNFNGDGIIVGDQVAVYGEFIDIKQYELTMGGTVKVPSVNAEVITLLKAR